jgi:acyl-CoA synthetase (AMP-forming)/AMP-acid ligase II
VTTREHPETIVEMVRRRAEHRADDLALAWAKTDDGEAVRLTYRQLDAGAHSVAAALRGKGAELGDRAVLLYPAGLEFVVGYLGCLYAGVIAVPAPLPRRGVRDARLASIATGSAPAFVLCAAATAASDLLDRHPELARADRIATGLAGADQSDAGAGGTATAWTDPRVTSSTIAMLQYTSGSSSDPKGVVVTHANLVSNLAAAIDTFGLGPDDIGVSWLPHFHDMGLIGGILLPLSAGFPATLFSPTSFVQRPARWLELISRLGATASGSPGFGYALATRRVSDEVLASLDLHRWTLALNGAEPVRADVMDAFVARFGARGFRAEAFAPSYGLAEATILVSAGRSSGGPVVITADAGALGAGRLVRAAEGAVGRTLVSSGTIAPTVDVVIVDPEERERCGPGRVGEIWIGGPSVANGYWHDPELTARTFAGTIASAPAILASSTAASCSSPAGAAT